MEAKIIYLEFVFVVEIYTLDGRKRALLRKANLKKRFCNTQQTFKVGYWSDPANGAAMEVVTAGVLETVITLLY